MANLLGQNIGTNYKGILNLNTLNGNLSGTLQAVTDGDGNASPLQLSTTEVAMLAATFFGASSATTNILTLQSTTRNQLKVESGSTLEFWRSAGVESARFDANGNFLISATSASARLQVRGDGTNPIARFESNDGSINWSFTAGGFSLTNSYQAGIFGAAISGDYSFAAGSYNNLAGTGAFQGIANINGTIAVPSSGTGTKHILAVNYTINNAGAQTGTATGIYLNATETALNGMTHNLMDLQVGGVSKFVVKSNAAGFINDVNGLFVGNQIETGNYNATSGLYGYNVANQAYVLSNATGNIILKNSAGDYTSGSFNMLILGAATNAFPAIKRNGAGIDFRLADDSGFCGINAGEIGASVGFFAPNSTEVRGTYIRARASTFLNFSDGTQGILIDSASGTSASASAILQANSTTKGFLPPRMTTTQRDLIATPAAGLMIYNTTTNRPNFYDGSAWVAL
jgi:hypothetical protein